MSLLHSEPATIAQLERQLRELRASASGRWLRPSGQGPAAEIDLGRTVTERGVVLFCLGGAPAGASAAMLTRLICRDLLAAGTALHQIGVAGDGIVWLAECGSMPRSSVTDLIARGPGTGLPVLAATTSARVAAELVELTNVVVLHRMDDVAAARHLAEVAVGEDPAPEIRPGSPAGLAAPRDGEFLLAVKNPRRLVPSALAIRTRIPPPARHASAAAGQRAREGA